MTPKEQFVAELEPMLIEAEKAIVTGDRAESQRLALAMMKLTLEWGNKLSDAELRDALNNPIANAIAKRLGVKP